jgi:hypothetical protein
MGDEDDEDVVRMDVPQPSANLTGLLEEIFGVSPLAARSLAYLFDEFIDSRRGVESSIQQGVKSNIQPSIESVDESGCFCEHAPG